MRIAVVGTGYVGLVSGTCFADMGNKVWCVDVNEEKIKSLEAGIIPIFEPGLEELVQINRRNKSLFFTTKIQEALKEATVVFIAVGTPMGEDGSADLQYVLSVASDIGKYMQHHMYVVDKSTVPVGTAAKVAATIQKELDTRKSDLTFDMISNPEFLKEGTAIEDSTRPDRIVIGTESKEAEDVMRELYAPYIRTAENFIAMDIASAEMTKYTANAMLATKISFMNEISNICERVGADVNKVRIGIGSDRRIGYSFIYPGCGYGGSCFPKDVQALINTSHVFGYEAKILQAVEKVNFEQKRVIPQKVVKRFGEDLTGMTFGLWGLAFKPDTDDMRQAPSVEIVKELTSRGAHILAYDPQAVREAKTCYLKGNDKITYVESKYDAIKGADALILVTEWKEFRSPDFDEIKKDLKNAVLFDGRNLFDKEKMNKLGFEYFQIGVNE